MPHPSGLLTADPDVRARLTRFGLRRIGAVADLARSALVARFGEEGARIHARARGEELEPFRPHRTPERLRLGLPIEPATEGLEPLRFVLHRLTAALTDQRASPWLFPGGRPGQPISASRLAERLRHIGMRSGQDRSTALFALAAELPAALLARMLGIHITVAVKWQHASAGDWTNYAADYARREPPDHHPAQGYSETSNI